MNSVTNVYFLKLFPFGNYLCSFSIVSRNQNRKTCLRHDAFREWLYGEWRNVLVCSICRFAGRDSGFGRGNFGGGSNSSGPGARLVKPQWDLSRLPKFEKHFYKEHPATASRASVCMVFSFVVLKIFLLKVCLMSSKMYTSYIIILSFLVSCSPVTVS